MSAFLVTATAGVTFQPRRSVCRADAAAPVWPSIWLYAAFSTRRPKTNVVASSASGNPIVAQIHHGPRNTASSANTRGDAEEDPGEHEPDLRV